MHRQPHGVLFADLGSKRATKRIGISSSRTGQLLASMDHVATAAASVAPQEHPTAATGSVAAHQERIVTIAAENAVVVFSTPGCCMCHVVKKLFCGLGVSPMVVEVDRESDGGALEKALVEMVDERQPLPAIFVGGKLLGGIDRLMTAHISGMLIPQLKAAGALWL